MLRHGFIVLFCLGLGASAAGAFEGNYSSDGRKLKITRQGQLYRVDLDAGSPGCMATHTATGTVRGDTLESREGDGTSVCMLQTRMTGNGVVVSESRDCREYRGARCQNFAGSYTRIGGGPPGRSSTGAKPGWKTETKGGRTAAFARNGSGSASLMIECVGPAGGRFLSAAMLGVPKGFKPFRGGETAEIRVGQAGAAFILEGGREHAALTVMPASRANTAALIAAFGAGGAVTLSGQPFAGVGQADRTFNAAGGAAPIAALQARCR